MLVDMLARANSVSLLALPRSDRRVLALLLVRVEWGVLCCAVLCLRSKESKKKQGGSPKINVPVGNYRLRRAERREKIQTMSPEVGEF